MDMQEFYARQDSYSKHRKIKKTIIDLMCIVGAFGVSIVCVAIAFQLNG